jgi:ABC-2 type transport system permease protein
MTAYGITLPRVVRSEWTKIRSLRSSVWALLTTVALVVGPGVLVCVFRVANWPPDNAADIANFDPAAASLTGVYLAQLAIGVLGALVVTGEYATGMIRTTFSTVPRRLTTLAAKGVAFALAAFAVSLVACLATFLIGQSILAGKGIDASLGDPGVAHTVIGGALYLTAVGLLGLGLGALLRSTAVAVGALVGVLMVVPIIFGFMPASVSDAAYRYLPMPAGTAVTVIDPDPTTSLGAWVGLGLFGLYTAAVLAVAAWRLPRRDVAPS